MQLQAFDPATVIAEGQTALQCLNSLKRKAGTELISIPDIPVQNPERLQYVQAWTRLLLDLSPAGTTLLAFSGSGLQAQAESADIAPWPADLRSTDIAYCETPLRPWARSPRPQA